MSRLSVRRRAAQLQRATSFLLPPSSRFTLHILPTASLSPTSPFSSQLPYPTMAGLVFTVPTDYKYVLAVATSTGFLGFYQSIVVSKWRKAAGIKYPAMYATNEQAENDPKAKIFNCAQRAHGNTLESLPFFLFSLLYVGLSHPHAAAILGSTWVVGRVLYTIGYVTGNPAKRQFGVFHNIGFYGLLGTAAYTAFKSIF